MKTRLLPLLLITLFLNQSLYAQFASSCLTDTVNVSSGYNHATAATYLVSPSSASPTLDKYWLVTDIPTNTTSLVPTRCAELLTAKGLSDVSASNTARAAWIGIVAYPYPSNTAQLSPTANFFWNCPPGTPYTPTKTPITFTRSFYVQSTKALDTIRINVANIIGDDYVRVYLDGSVVILNPTSSTTFGTGPFNISLPVSSGVHTLDIKLWDVSGQLSAIRVDANITAKSKILISNSCFGEASSTCSIITPSPDPCVGTVANFKDTNSSCYTFDFKDLSVAKDSGITTWNWTFGDGGTATIKNPTHTYADYGTYNVRLIIRDSSGCIDTFSKSVTVAYKHFANAGRDTTLCLFNGNVTTFLVGNKGSKSYSWTPTSGLSNSSSANTYATLSVPTTYYLAATDSFGCVDKDTVFVNLYPQAIVQASPKDTSVCAGTILQLRAKGAVHYQWSPSSGLDFDTIANPKLKATTTTTYMVKGTNSNGCIAFDSLKVTIEKAVLVDAQPKNVAGCANDKVQLNVTGDAAFYKWSPAEGLSADSIADPIVTIGKSRTYYVTGKTLAGCEGYDSVVVILYPNPVVDAYSSENVIKCRGGSIRLNATGANSYEWQPAEFCDDNKISSPMVNPMKTTVFTVTGSNNLGCKATDTISVIFEGKAVVYIPNAFTPDGDGINDKFGVIDNCNLKFHSMRIFDRWGENLFTTFNQSEKWDGTYEGKRCNMEVYFYIINGTDLEGNDVMKSGDFTLVR